MYAVYGFPVAIGRSLVLLQRLEDFNLDGFVVLPLSDITDVRSDDYERFAERVLRDERRLRDVHSPETSFGLDDWGGVFSALGAAGEIVIVECEDHPDEDFCIGLVTAVASDAVGVHQFDATAVWDPAPTVIHYDRITRVRFAERYTQVFDRYVGNPPT